MTGQDLATIDAAVKAALARDDVAEAIHLALDALDRDMVTPLFLNLAAHDHEQKGRYREALSLLDMALMLNPRDPFVLGARGDCLSKSGRVAEALAAYEAAIAIWPEFPRGHHGRGLALSVLGDADGAQVAQTRAAALDPSFPDPLGALAALCLQAGDLMAARNYAMQALSLDSGQPTAALTLAMIDLREGRDADAAKGARVLLAKANLSLLHEASAQRLLADALDALEDPQGAIEAYQAANLALRRVYVADAQAAGLEFGVELADRLISFVQEAKAKPWTPVLGDDSAKSPPRVHVFLLGFPRSGTTLLEQVLASHPDVVALEERPTLDPVLDDFFGDTAALDRLMAMDHAVANRQRTDYWRRVAEFGIHAEGKVFIDKVPLNTLYQPLIAKLFPDARIILAQRDPRDVVVSCFRRRFQPNRLVIEYTDLTRTAQFYDRVMQVAELYRAWLPLPVHVHRHESLIDAFDTETQALCAFLDLDWRASMRDFVLTAERRDIRTPSADQVRRGIYREGMGQWRRYREALTEVLPILQPWVEQFGYDAV